MLTPGVLRASLLGCRWQVSRCNMCFRLGAELRIQFREIGEIVRGKKIDTAGNRAFSKQSVVG